MIILANYILHINSFLKVFLKSIPILERKDKACFQGGIPNMNADAAISYEEKRVLIK